MLNHCAFQGYLCHRVAHAWFPSSRRKDVSHYLPGVKIPHKKRHFRNNRMPEMTRMIHIQLQLHIYIYMIYIYTLGLSYCLLQSINNKYMIPLF